MILKEEFNPRFRLGESNEHFCDCIGLVIYFLRAKGFKCEWERGVVRLPTSWDIFQEELSFHNFSRSKQSDYPAVIWKNPDQTAHIGLFFEDKVYHMQPSGIQIKLYEGEQLWYYCGN